MNDGNNWAERWGVLPDVLQISRSYEEVEALHTETRIQVEEFLHDPKRDGVKILCEAFQLAAYRAYLLGVEDGLKHGTKS